MTTINTIEDFVRVMDDNPEWLEAIRARLLTRELLEMPRRLEELTAVVQQMADTQREQGRDIAEQGRDIAELKDTQREQGGDIAEQRRDIAELKETQREQGRDIAELKDTARRMEETQREHGSDIAELKETQREHGSDIAELKEMQRQMIESQNRMLETQIRQGRDIAVLKGVHTEFQLERQVYGLLGGDPLSLSRVRIVRGPGWSREMDQFNMDLGYARDDARISPRQYQRVVQTDLIALARRRGSPQDVYVAIEASFKIDRDDIDRATQTGEILETVFPHAEIQAAVYGHEISERDEVYAESQSVTVFVVQPPS